MSDHIEETILIVDDFLGQFDGCMMLVPDLSCTIKDSNMRGLLAPVGSTGGRIKGFTPYEVDAA